MQAPLTKMIRSLLTLKGLVIRRCLCVSYKFPGMNPSLIVQLRLWFQDEHQQIWAVASIGSHTFPCPNHMVLCVRSSNPAALGK